jgi:hypothetical protein
MRSYRGLEIGKDVVRQYDGCKQPHFAISIITV